jgi:acetamidase/formamidase
VIHILESTPETFVDVYSAAHFPAAVVSSGDTVVVHTLDSHGRLSPEIDPALPQPKVFRALRGHCLAGPIEVEGAVPGQTLAITFDSLKPDAWGFTGAGGRTNELYRLLGLEGAERVMLHWQIDVDAGVARNQLGHRVTLGPFLGVVGLGLPGGEHSTIPPRTLGGGNIDCRELTEGSTLYLPVQVAGAMLYLGDGHAAQGDGEVSGQAIECGMTSRVTLTLLDDAPVATIHARTPNKRITFGFDADLNIASAAALKAMIGWIARDVGTDEVTAFALASTVVDLHVTQVANETWGVHATLEDGRLAGGPDADSNAVSGSDAVYDSDSSFDLRLDPDGER